MIIADKDLITVKQAAERLNCGTAKLYCLLQAKKMPGYKFGGRWLISTKKLQEHLEKFSNAAKIGGK